jgi:Family of unknown function (DUF6318)
MRRYSVGRPFRWVGIAVALGLASVTSACTTPSLPPVESSSTAPAASSSTTPKTSARSTSSGAATTASDIPEAAKANTAEGAEAFTRFFAERANFAYDTLDPEIVRSLSAPECKTCQAMITSLTQWRDAKYRYDGKFVAPTSIQISAFPSDGTAKTLLVGSSPESKLLDQSGAIVQRFPATSASSSVFLAYQEGHWRVTEVKRSA